jgi:hypothetical protein
MCLAFHFSLCLEADQRSELAGHHNGLIVGTAEFLVRSEIVIDFHPLVSCPVVVLMLQHPVRPLRP